MFIGTLLNIDLHVTKSQDHHANFIKIILLMINRHHHAGIKPLDFVTPNSHLKLQRITLKGVVRIAGMKEKYG